MKDSYDKDPFAEYDKYWDDLDKKEELSNRKRKKDFHFKQTPSQTNRHENDINKKAVSIFIGVFFLFMFGSVLIPIIINFTSSPFDSYPGMGMNISVFAPFFGFIFFIMIIGFIIKASKKD